MYDIREKAKTVTDVIGEEYKLWKPCNTILITAPTGTGKSYFVVHTLLKWVQEQGERILYLVNRRILKEQLEEEIYEEVGYMPNYNLGLEFPITVRTYQSIEQELINNKNLDLKQYSIIIYDECHYFYEDSNFNTNTELVFDFLRRFSNFKIQVFISATIEKIRDSLQYRLPIFLEWGERNELTGMQQFNKRINGKIYEYAITSDYNYVDLFAFEDINQLGDIIKQEDSLNKEKWLIFTDSIERGEEFKKELLESTEKGSLKRDDVVFITRKYEEDEQANDCTTIISKMKKAKEKVVIATAVMDNGISFCDDELRNIVIMADTKEAFIQMLGRKRVDTEQVKVYICRRNKLHFSNRLQAMKKILSAYRQYQEYFTNATCYSIPMWDGNNNRGYYKNENLYPHTAMCYSGYPNYIEQERILSNIFRSEWLYNQLKKICYTYRGHIELNHFSLSRCDNLKRFYADMEKRIGEDPDVFIKVQARWLGKNEEEIEEVVSDLEKSYKKKLENIIKDKIDKEMDKSENIQLKKDIKKYLKYFLEKGKEYDKNEYNNATKLERPISASVFDSCMKKIDLPFYMKSSGSPMRYTIKKRTL